MVASLESCQRMVAEATSGSAVMLYMFGQVVAQVTVNVRKEVCDKPLERKFTDSSLS